MKIEVYAVHDSAIGAFNRPLFFRSRGEAIRSFQDAVADEQSGFRAHASHYSLHQIGTYDDSTGLVEPMSPERVCGATDFLLPDPVKIGS